MMRRVGERVQTGQRYRLRAGAYAVPVLGRRVLLTHQRVPIPEFQLPGGGIDPGEAPVRALHREVFEETGWRVTAPRRIGAFRRFTYMPVYDQWAEKVCHVYLVRPTIQLSAPTEPDHQAIWVDQSLVGDVLTNEGDRFWALRALGL